MQQPTEPGNSLPPVKFPDPIAKQIKEGLERREALGWPPASFEQGLEVMFLLFGGWPAWKKLNEPPEDLSAPASPVEEREDEPLSIKYNMPHLVERNYFKAQLSRANDKIKELTESKPSHVIEIGEQNQQIRKMAEAYADPKFAHDSFRWSHMVRVYIDAIKEWELARLRQMEFNNEDKPPYSMPLASHPAPSLIVGERGPDLSKIEEQVDKVLAAEADESLREWHDRQRSAPTGQALPEEVGREIDNDGVAYAKALEETYKENYKSLSRHPVVDYAAGAIAMYHKMQDTSLIHSLGKQNYEKAVRIKELEQVIKEKQQWIDGHM